MLVCALLLILGTALQPVLGRKSYENYKVYSVMPTDLASLEVLHNMMLHDVAVDFWKEPSRLNQKVTFMVSPSQQLRVVTKLRRADIEFTVDSYNYQELLDPMWAEIDKRRSVGPYVFDNNAYNTIEDINVWMTELATRCATGLQCEVYSLGNSYEGRPINLFHISKNAAGRKAYYLEATTHAREWISTATLTNILETLALSADATSARLTDSYDWYLVPVVNVDGYAYTWSDDRQWRKNRRPIGACVGVDLNRNYDYNWGNDGASDVPCSDTYCGPNGGSEPETQAISAELNRIGATLGGMVTMHSYGNMWMFPWGNTVNFAGRVCERAADHDELMRVADITANAIEDTNNTNWGRGNSCEVIYATTGGTNDYAKGVAGVAYAYVPELRGNAFIVPVAQIPESFQEVYNGIVAMVDAIGA